MNEFKKTNCYFRVLDVMLVHPAFTCSHARFVLKVKLDCKYFIRLHSGGSRVSQTGRGPKPLNLGLKPIIWQFFSRKLHENGRNWTEMEAHPQPPLPIRQFFRRKSNLYSYQIMETRLTNHWGILTPLGTF